MSEKITRITPAAGVTLQGPPTSQDSGGAPVPFRKASQRKIERGAVDNALAAVGPQSLMSVVEGTGYLESVDIEVVAVEAGNAAAVAYVGGAVTDMPWNALSNISFKAVGPDLFNLTGYQLYLLNMYGGHGVNAGRGPSVFVTADPMFYSGVIGGGGTAGSMRYTLRLPLAINARSMVGILGNQDSGTKYQLTTVLNSLAGMFTVAPNGAAGLNFRISKYLNYSAVPAPVDNLNRKQQQIPPAYGVLHMVNSLRSEAQVLSATRVNHYIRNLGNTTRLMILVFRLASGLRSDLPLHTLATHTDAQIVFRIGDDVLIQETAGHRRKLMWDRYHFDAPAGVLVYDWISDFSREPGFELGDDWMNTANIPNAQFEINYPTFAGGPGILEILTDELVIPPSIDIAQAM